MITENEEDNPVIEINLAAYLREDEVIWCLIWQDTFLYKINRSQNIMRQVVPLLDEVYKEKAFTAIIPYGDYLVFVPGTADCVVMFDRTNNTKQCWQIPLKEKKIGDGDFKFFSGLIFEDCLYMFGYSFPGILKWDLKSKEFYNIDEWLERAVGYFTNEVDGCFHMRYHREGNTVFFPFMNMNAVLQFDLDTERTIVWEVGDAHQRFISIEYVNGNFWLIPRDGSRGRIVRWNPDKAEVQYFEHYPREFDYALYAFCSTVKMGEKIYLFSHASNMNIVLDAVTGNMEPFMELYDTSNIKAAKYIYMELVGDKIFILTSTYYIWWNPFQGAIERVAITQGDEIRDRYKVKREEELKQKDMLQRLRNIFKSGDAMQEDEGLNLNEFIIYITKG